MTSNTIIGAGTNLKVGAHVRREAPENCRAPPFFGSTDTMNRFCERFCGGQYSLVSFLLLFFYSRCPMPYGVGVTEHHNYKCYR